MGIIVKGGIVGIGKLGVRPVPAGRQRVGAGTAGVAGLKRPCPRNTGDSRAVGDKRAGLTCVEVAIAGGDHIPGVCFRGCQIGQMEVTRGIQRSDLHIPIGLRRVLVIEFQRIDIGKPRQIRRRAGDVDRGELQGRETVRNDAHRDVIEEEEILVAAQIAESDVRGIRNGVVGEVHNILVIGIVREIGGHNLRDTHIRAAVNRIGDIAHLHHSGGGILGTGVEGDSQILQVLGEKRHDGDAGVRRTGAENHAGGQGARKLEG